MWLRIFCVVVIASSSFAKKDELLDSLYGLEGRNKVSVCVATPSGRLRRCDGAMLSREWLLARALLLRAAPRRLAVERPSAGGSCERRAASELCTTGSHNTCATDTISCNTNVYSSRRARHVVFHPWFDLAMVIVRNPYNNLDHLPNATQTQHELRRHGLYKWMKHYFDIFALTRNHGYHVNRLARNLQTFHHPLWYFFVTMVLPSALLMAFFVYITFYTGSTKKTPQVPYKKLRYFKKVSHV